LNPYFNDPIYREPGDPPPLPADLQDLSPLTEPFTKYPFVPDDRMDWAFGIGFAVVPYAIAAMMGPAAFGTYVAVGPDIPLFITGVMVSNVIQSAGPALRVEAIHQAESYMTQSNPFFGMPGYV